MAVTGWVFWETASEIRAQGLSGSAQVRTCESTGKGAALGTLET